MSGYYFFLSYARLDSEGHEYLKKFYEDLALEVERIADPKFTQQPHTIGFFDQQGIEGGDLWPDKLLEALQTSRVFICMYSRGYFSRPYCGKEFQVFHSRVKKYVEAHPVAPAPPLIIPVLWDSKDFVSKFIPPPVSQIQHWTPPEASSGYSQYGLYQISKLSKYVDEYNQFLMHLARRVVEVAEQYADMPALPNIPALKDTLSAFEEPAAAGPAAGQAQEPDANTANFVFVAGRKNELMPVRQKVDTYGQGGEDWRPFSPDTLDDIGFLSHSAVNRERMSYRIMPLDPNLVDKIREAEESNSIVIIIVDPWSIRVNTYAKPMQDLDKNTFINCEVLIPWNPKDDETQTRAPWLEEGMKNTFNRSFRLNTAYLRSSIRSAEELEKQIITSINDVRRRLYQTGSVFRQVPGGANEPVPTISGTTGK